MTKKILSIVFSLVFMSALAFSISWGVINFNKVRTGMASTGVYTNEDLTKSYEDGYDNALKDKAEYTATIAECRDTITSLNDKISQLNFQLSTLSDNNQDCNVKINNLINQKNELESQVENLQEIKNRNENTIQALNSQIAVLRTQANQVPTLNSQITNIQNTVDLLQSVNSSNAATITKLNNQIISLNNQINEMSVLSQDTSSRIAVLNNKIKEYETSITYYENFIAQLETDNKVVATYEFGDSIWKIEILNKGTEIVLTTPINTETKIFNGWKVAGQNEILGNTYTINENTKFVADVSYIYPVKFIVDEQSYNEQNIMQNGYATVPTNPSKDGYVFNGWTVDGNDIVDITNYEITADTVFIAKFSIKTYTVTFKYENTIIDTQTVNYGFFARDVVVGNTQYKIFNGWKLNGALTDISLIQINNNTEFEADIIYCYDVKFLVDDEIYSSQIVANNRTATVPASPVKGGYEFDYWTLNDAVINIDEVLITGETIFIANFTKLHQVTFVNGTEVYQIQQVRNGSKPAFVNVDNTAHLIFEGWTVNGNDIVDVFNYSVTDDLTFTAKCRYTKVFLKIDNWNVENIYGDDIWYYGDTVYYSCGSQQYVLNKETNQFEPMLWNGLTSFYGRRIRKIAERYWYFTSKGNKHYYLQEDTKTWVRQDWTYGDSRYRMTAYIDGTNVFEFHGYYYTLLGAQSLLLNPSDFTGEEVTIQINGVVPDKMNFQSGRIWGDGSHYYYDTEYELLPTHVTTILNLVSKSWVGEAVLKTNYVKNIYGELYSFADDGSNGRTSALITKINVASGRLNKYEWAVIPSVDGVIHADYVWTDGSKWYYSNGKDKQYLLMF